MKLQTIKNVSKKGFTLIELLVVITIIGILATGATSTYTSQIQKARDTTRINDIKAIQSSVEQVYQDAMEYPVTDPTSTVSPTFDYIEDYIDKYPEDSKHLKPSNISWATTLTANDSQLLWYTYNVWPDENGIDNWNFEVSTWFEAKWNITWKAVTDSLGDLNQDVNRLEVWTASRSAWLVTAVRWTSWTATADGNWACIITSANWCTDY